ncbi:MAG: phosphatidate cytidylyltransferase [Fimbriimonadaceae bacterium]|nr:phosphatidate cytidylyltransferase [Fimbriimonadaceae bacterium]
MRARVITSLVAIAIGLGALGWNNPIGIYVLASLVLIRAMVELHRLFPWPGKSIWSWGIAAGTVAWGALCSLDMVPPIAALLTFVGAGGLIAAARLQKVGLGSLLGAIWIAAPVIMMMRLHQYGDDAQIWSLRFVMLLLMPLWGGDSLALFVGKQWGKHPMAPEISPGKTWEGALGHLIGCMIGSFLYTSLAGVPHWVAIMVGLTASVIGQLGDLVQSYAKRSAGLKDSGQLLPGHGGLLDRLDSTLLSAPVTATLVTFLYFFSEASR